MCFHRRVVFHARISAIEHRGRRRNDSYHRRSAFTTWRQPTSLQINDHVENFPETDAYRDMFEAVSGRILGRSEWLLDPSASVRVATIVDALR